MTFTYQAYCDILDAMEAHGREPRPCGEPSQVDEAIARLHCEPHRAVGWAVSPDVPAKMQQAAANRSGQPGMVP